MTRLLVLLLLFSAVPAAGADFPNRPVRLIVPFPPGGPLDIVGRLVGRKLSEQWAQPVVIENRAGASGAIGTSELAKSPPDGYTLLVNSTPIVSTPHMQKLPYDTLRDLVGVSQIAGIDYVLVATPRSGIGSVDELIARAKQQPGKLNYASGGVGQSSHMAMELFRQVAGIDLVHVPYKGAGPGMTAVLASEVDAIFAAIPAAVPLLRADKLRAIAVGGTRRSPQLPEIPTIRESGYASDASSWYGMLAPRATPEPIIKRLHDTLVSTMQAPAMRSRLVDIGFEVIASSPAEFATHIRNEMATWRKVITAAGLKKRE